MNNSFISKSELALAYFPYISKESARHKLMSYILDNHALHDRLIQTGYTFRTRSFSPKQLGIIYEYLGCPFNH